MQNGYSFSVAVGRKPSSQSYDDQEFHEQEAGDCIDEIFKDIDRYLNVEAGVDLMHVYMKFTTYRKETEDKEYREDPYRAVNFPVNDQGCPVCPGGKENHYLRSQPIRYNYYERTEELWQCEDCSNCALKGKCCKSSGNRIVSLNEELSASIGK